MNSTSTEGIKRLLQMPISRRLPIVTMAMALMTAAMGGLLYFQSYQNSLTEVEATLTTLAGDEADQVRLWYETIERELLAASEEPSARESLDLLSAAGAADGGLATAKSAYVEKNPHPLGERQALFDAADGSAYSKVHLRVHQRFARLREVLGFYDLFLFDLDGNLLYTVVKEADFGENIVTGPYAEKGLGGVFI